MPSLWTYPWTLEYDGLDNTCERVADLGIDAVNVASHYHSVRSMQPRSPDELFRVFPGGCYFEPGAVFNDVPIEPTVNDMGSWDDPLAAIVDGVHAYDLAVNAWTVCLHNTRLGADNPNYRIESAFGDVHDHSLCPSHQAVQDYFAAVARSIADRGVDEVQLESIGFPSAFHDHGAQFGHDKRQTVTTATGEALLSQCFCDGCQAAAASHPVDFNRAQSRVHDIVRESLADPTASLPPIDELCKDEPLIQSLFDFRATVIESLVEQLADATGSIPLNYYVMEAFGSEPSTLSAAGVDLSVLERHLDRATAICYVGDAGTARDRLAAVANNIDLPVDIGVTLDPEVIDHRDQFLDLIHGVLSAADGNLSIYHHSLATETQLEWIGAALD